MIILAAIACFMGTTPGSVQCSAAYDMHNEYYDEEACHMEVDVLIDKSTDRELDHLAKGDYQKRYICINWDDSKPKSLIIPFVKTMAGYHAREQA